MSNLRLISLSSTSRTRRPAFCWIGDSISPLLCCVALGTVVTSATGYCSAKSCVAEPFRDTSVGGGKGLSGGSSVAMVNDMLCDGV